jgi:hypothetical protein
MANETGDVKILGNFSKLIELVSVVTSEVASVPKGGAYLGTSPG